MKVERRNDEIRNPQTKEFVITSIHDAVLLAQIKEMIQGMESGIRKTSLDDEYLHVAMFADAYIRLIDTRTFLSLVSEIRDNLDNNADTASFVIVDSKESLPIQHPRLHRLQDVTIEWVATEIAKGREWDTRECDRYYREVREQDE